MSVQSLLEQVASAVANLRVTLQDNATDQLPDALTQAQAALDTLNAYPGGVPQLRQDIEAENDDVREHVQKLLGQAAIDHKINGDLIKLAMQKNAALQAFVAQQSAAATYSNSGGVPSSVVGGMLSTKV